MNFIQVLILTTWVFLLYKYFTTKNKAADEPVCGIKLAYLVASTLIGVLYWAV